MIIKSIVTKVQQQWGRIQLKPSDRTRTTEQAFIQGPREASVTWNQSPTVKQEARISYEAVNSMAL